INITTYFPHRKLPYRGFVTGSFLFSSFSIHLQGSLSRFSLPVHHTSVSSRCSVRRFDGCPRQATIGRPIYSLPNSPPSILKHSSPTLSSIKTVAGLRALQVRPEINIIKTV